MRDSSAGIGTLTFYDEENGTFAGLGHAVCDVDTGDVLPLLSGEIVSARSRASCAASRKSWRAQGHFSRCRSHRHPETKLRSRDLRHDGGRAGRGRIHGYCAETGGSGRPAEILATVDGAEAERYTIEIERINYSDGNPTKNSGDPRNRPRAAGKRPAASYRALSGSPILQDGRLVGARDARFCERRHPWLCDLCRKHGRDRRGNRIDTCRRRKRSEPVELILTKHLCKFL